MFLLGADPEVFVAKDGEFVCAHGLIPGTKEAPYVVHRGAVQVDGAALEFNTLPCASYKEFQDNIDLMISTLQGMVPDFDLLPNAAVEIPAGMREALPPEVLQIGCNPDFNAYTEEMNPPPDEATNIRAAGGHLHIGGIFLPEYTDKQKYKSSLRLARLLDKYVGVYSILWDKDTLRRKVYGSAGACRLKPYGVEYRTLSNRWVFSRDITRFVYDGVCDAVLALYRGEEVEGPLYRNIINNYDVNHLFFRDNKTAEIARSLA